MTFERFIYSFVCFWCLVRSAQYLSLKKNISPRRVVTASRTSWGSQAFGVVGPSGSGFTTLTSGLEPKISNSPINVHRNNFSYTTIKQMHCQKFWAAVSAILHQHVSKVSQNGQTMAGSTFVLLWQLTAIVGSPTCLAREG